MKINSLKIINHHEGWEIDTIHFDRLNLLVGVSGAGKTRILESLELLGNIFSPYSIFEEFNGFEWCLNYITKDGKVCEWRGRFEKIEKENIFVVFDSDSDKNGKKYRIVNESFSIDGVIVLERTNINNIIVFNEKQEKIENLFDFKSALNIFRSDGETETLFEQAVSEIEYMKLKDYRDRTSNFKLISDEHIEKLKETFKSYEELTIVGGNNITKLHWVYLDYPEIFRQVRDKFIVIFPKVENIIFRKIKVKTFSKLELFDVLFIKEKGVKKWIRIDKLSAGMLRTLFYICDIYLSPKGTVILIDEFENNLDVNCLSLLTEDLLLENQDIQFILTSHHPYIINHIPHEYWKIVTRQGNKIQVKDAKDLHLKGSKQAVFMKLLDLFDEQRIPQNSSLIHSLLHKGKEIWDSIFNKKFPKAERKSDS